MLGTNVNEGGAQAQLVLCAVEMRARGWECLVVPLIESNAFAEELASHGVRVEHLGMTRGIPDPRGLLRYVRLVRQFRPTVVSSSMFHANLLSRLGRPFSRVPILVSIAQNTFEGGQLRTLLYRLTDPLSDLTLQVSRAGVERYVEIGAVPRRKIAWLPNSVKVERYHPDTEARRRLRAELGIDRELVWLAVGRLEPQKDYPNMLRAFKRLLAMGGEGDGREVEHPLLLVAGHGRLRKQLVEAVSELGLDNHVRFLGMRRDVDALMNAADAYVMSSAWEGTPLALLEAAATGLPIVATEVGGNGDVVLDGRSGRLVPPHDTEALAAAMHSLGELPLEERRRFGMRGREHVRRHYSVEKVVDRFEEILSGLDRGGST